MKIIVVNGFPGCGKTTFEHCCWIYWKGTTRIISTVDFVKEVASKCGWNGEKTPKNRKFLSDLKDLLSSWDDVPFKHVSNFIAFEQGTENARPEFGERLIFIDCREPKEIQRFKDEFGAKALLIRRPTEDDVEFSNHADAEVENFEYDYIIYNDGDLKEFEKKARLFCENLR